jgi:OOP family OmpA-OmpF porin
MAELNYDLSDRWKIYANYHFMIMDDPNLDGGAFFGPGGSIDVEKTDHAVMLGLRFDLQSDGVVAPEPDRPVPAEPRRPKQFIVFFGFNKANLSAEAQRVVSEAAAAAKQYGSAEILVVGHTDTVGSPSYNMRLSMRRAGAVKAELSNNGKAKAAFGPPFSCLAYRRAPRFLRCR